MQNVPDMPDPGPGASTFHWTDQQSARLMFYHDHAWGITRLNVYAGEAAAWTEMGEDLPDLAGSMAGARPTDLTCPRCAGAFVEIPYVAGGDVLLDRCGGCGGLWFDAGEVPKVERIAAGLGDPRSKVLRAMAHVKAHGYQVIGVRKA